MLVQFKPFQLAVIFCFKYSGIVSFLISCLVDFILQGQIKDRKILKVLTHVILTAYKRSYHGFQCDLDGYELLLVAFSLKVMGLIAVFDDILTGIYEKTKQSLSFF